MTVREALVHSLNVPMVRLGMAVGLPPIAERLTDLGFSLPKPAPSVLLGALEAAPLEVARAYAALASGGVLPVPTSEPVPAAGARRVFTGPAATDVLVALREVVRTGTAASLRGRVEGPLGGKTGTTDGRRDSWFVALRPRLVTVVWLGTDGNHETELFGATGALEVWQQIDSRLPAVFRGDTGEQLRPSRMDR
ncbi:MAG: penicillin-binding transpeptidase domain-containing protein [Acidobacteriota bacterium]